MSMEQLEVPSRSYIVRWVECSAGFTISWSLKPHKKSLNFGIFRKPAANGDAAKGDDAASVKRPQTARNRSNEGDALIKLHAAGLQDVYWHGNCEADRVANGTYQVQEGGHFAMVFDNTFSKQISKTVTFVLLTYPSNQPPPATHALHHVKSSGHLRPGTSVGAPTANRASTIASNQTARPGSNHDSEPTAGGFHTGVLKKRKRKKHQGFARRYFSLDFTTCTLSYYLNRESSALRGAIPLSLAAISANVKDREICLDSGVEVWHLRANSEAEWTSWKEALEKAAKTSKINGTTGSKGAPLEGGSPHVNDERAWAEVEGLVSRVAGIRDAVRRLAATAESQNNPLNISIGSEAASSSTSIASVESSEKPKRPFWKRKQSSPVGSVPTAIPQSPNSRPKSVSALVAGSSASAIGAPASQQVPSIMEPDIYSHLNAITGDLDAAVSDFSRVLSEKKQRSWLHRRQSTLRVEPEAQGRASMDSSLSEEFFDAEDAFEDPVAVLNEADSDREASSQEAATDDEDSGAEEDSLEEKGPQPVEELAKPTTAKKDLYPLPVDPVSRRTAIDAASCAPPSLIGMFRKNVGKDLSTIAMPVTSNEPTSMLQRVAEQLEYSELLDTAATRPAERGERLLYIAAFAISGFSVNRIKERGARKPFNPMLGETFELVREDKGFRFLAEKVCHRPVIMACQADSATWSLSQSPQPSQHFWGKSAELTTAGRVRIQFPKTGDSYTYSLASSFLRNVIAGEKYVEPVRTMNIYHDNTGQKAVVTFKEKKGMWAGRSEDVSCEAFTAEGELLPLSLNGKWTESLELIDGATSTEIWAVGPTVPNAQTCYGFTQFAAQMNELTTVEEGKLPPTDSRLRPDQRLYEQGLVDDAETLKVKLEETQRQRRKELEEQGVNYKPKWFKKVKELADEEVWKMEDDEYWECRKKGNWEVCPKIFEGDS